MTRRKTPAVQPAIVPEADAIAPADKLKQSQEKLTRMEETQRLCFRWQNDLKKLASELSQRQYKEFEIIYLLEPKGHRHIPGYQKSEMDRQRQYVQYLSQARTEPVASPTELVEH